MTSQPADTGGTKVARLWQSGAELNSVTSGVEFTTANVSGELTISTTTVRSGTYAARFTGLVSGQGASLSKEFQPGGGLGPYFFRCYFRVATLPSADNAIFMLNNTNNFTSPIVWIDLGSDGTLELNDEDGVIGSRSSALSVDTWYCLEVKTDLTGAGANDVIEARIDAAAAFASSSTRTVGGFDFALWGCNMRLEAQTTGDWFFDDLAINDSTGSFQTSYPGLNSGIIHLRPNAAGDTDDWDLTTTFEDIDEVTPDDATTLINSLTIEATHEVNIDATPAAIASGDTINVVQVGVRCNESVGTDPDPTMVLRIKASASGTVEEGTTLTLASTTWRTHGTAAPLLPSLTLYDLPGASTTAYTKADLDTTQIGARLTNSPTGLAQISTMWLSVDYTAVAGGTTYTTTGGAIGVTVAQGDQAAIFVRGATGAAVTVAQGLRNFELSRVGGATAVTVAQGTRIVAYDRAGGAVAVTLAQGDRAVTLSRTGGAIAVTVAQGTSAQNATYIVTGGAMAVTVAQGNRNVELGRVGGAIAVTFGSGATPAAAVTEPEIQFAGTSGGLSIKMPAASRLRDDDEEILLILL